MQPGGRPNAVKRPHSALSASTTATNHTGQKASKQPAGWQLYFPLVEWQPILYQHWLTAFRSILPLMFPDLVEELRLSDNQLRVDYDHLLQSFDSYEQQQQQQTDEVDADQTSGSRLQRFLHDQPAVVFSLISLAAYQLATNDRPLPDLTAATIGQVLIIETRLVGHGYYTAMKELKAQMIGKLVTVRGTVVRISSVKSLITQIDFLCTQCGNRQVKHLDEGRYSVPGKCATAGCKSKAFVADRESSKTVSIDMQRIRLQEKLATTGDAGRVPRTVDIECIGYMVDRVIPGDVISITGIVKYSQISEGKGRSNKMATMHVLYIEANSIMHGFINKQQQQQQQQKITNNADQSFATNADFGKDQISFDMRDLHAIREIANEPDLFRLLVHSLCPSIYGHEMVKAGLLLALFGGRQRHNEASSGGGDSSVHIRGDSHVLIVGDPGLGKSQMLSAVAQTAPRGVYVCSNTTTSSGLTVTLTKEPGSNEFSLEAGALVLGDQGCCCIDEFDKLNEFDSLLEAMEQQSISIAKGGILCSLPARTSVIAAANPVGGHYNKAKTVSENLRMNSALLSRFDLIFIILDKPDEAMDRFLSNHVMRTHCSGGEHLNGDSSSVMANNENILPANQAPSSAPLKERLKSNANEQLDTIPSALLRRYIAYARQYVHPRLTVESAAILQDFYLQLRQNHRSADTTPITTRQLESMIRLSEARARSELRERVTKHDAMEVVEIMKTSLYDTYADEFGQPQFQRSQMGTGMSKRTEIKRFITKLHELHRQSYNNLFTFQQLFQVARELSISYGENFRDFLELVNHQNYLIKSGGNAYKLTNTGS